MIGLFWIPICHVPMTALCLMSTTLVEMAKTLYDIKANTRCEQINLKLIEFDEQLRVCLTLQKGIAINE